MTLQWRGERTCMTQGCIGPQNDASFEGSGALGYRVLKMDGFVKGKPFSKRVILDIHLELLGVYTLGILFGRFPPCFKTHIEFDFFFWGGVFCIRKGIQPKRTLPA